MRGVMPLYSAGKPSCLNMSFVMLTMREMAVVPGSAGVFWSLVLIVSMGALESGPMAPLTRPIIIVW